MSATPSRPTSRAREPCGIAPVLIDRRVNEPGHTHGLLPEGEDVPLVHDLFELADLLGVPRAVGTSTT